MRRNRSAGLALRAGPNQSCETAQLPSASAPRSTLSENARQADRIFQLLMGGLRGQSGAWRREHAIRSREHNVKDRAQRQRETPGGLHGREGLAG